MPDNLAVRSSMVNGEGAKKVNRSSYRHLRSGCKISQNKFGGYARASELGYSRMLLKPASRTHNSRARGTTLRGGVLS